MNSCPYCRDEHVPNARLKASMDELESGGGISFNTVAEMFAYLDTEDEDGQASFAPSSPRTAPQAQDETHRPDDTDG